MSTTSTSLNHSSRGVDSSDLARYGRLLLITLRRFGLWLPIAIVVVIGLVWLHYGLGTTYSRILLWSDVSIYIAISSAIIGTGCGVLMSFYAASRNRRNVNDLIASAAMSGWKTDTLTFALAACVGTVVYGVVASGYLLAASRLVHWGEPYWVILVAGLVTTIAYSMLGAAIGMIWTHRLAPFLTLITIILIFVGTAAQPGWHNETTVRDLSLWNVLIDQEYVYSPWYITRWTTNLLDCIWLAFGLSVASVTMTLAWRHRERSLLIACGIGVLTLLIPVVLVAGGFRTNANPWDYMEQSLRTDIELVCAVGTVGVEVCLHPAWVSDLEQATTIANEFIAPIQGLPGVPKKIVQSPAGQDPGRSETGDDTEALIYLAQYSDLEFSVPDAILEHIYHADGAGWTDTQNFLAKWLADRAGINGIMHYNMGGIVKSGTPPSTIDFSAAT